MARERHLPQNTLLYKIIHEHLDEFLRIAREEHGALNPFIEKTFRAYLRCGIPEHGFIRLHCESCGHNDIVAFSCKRRGICPSCSARAMADGAVHLVEHVLPEVPLRQWVISYPYELSGPLAFNADLLKAAERIVTDALSKWQSARSESGKTGGILIRHRFGGSLNVHIHAHLLMLDGVYRKGADGELYFEQSAPPQAHELEKLAENIHARLVGLCKRRKLFANDSVNNEDAQLDALSACTRLAMTTGNREKSGPALSLADEEEVEQPLGGMVARVNGLNLYASSVIDGKDRELVERVCRYLLRGPISLGRLKQREDGLLTYRMKKPDRRGNTVMVLSPVQLMMRLASLIPLPHHPTRKYFGILAAGAKDRPLVVPKPTTRKSAHCAKDGKPHASAVKWADLLKRIWGLDALQCVRCGKQMTPVAVVEDPEQIERYLRHQGAATVLERSRAPPLFAA